MHLITQFYGMFTPFQHTLWTIDQSLPKLHTSPKVDTLSRCLLVCKYTVEPLYKWTPLGPPLFVHNMEVSVFQGLLAGCGDCNQAGEHNMAAFLDLSICV